MFKSLIGLAAIAVAAGGCTSLQVRSSASVSFPAADKAEAHQVASEAALVAGFTLTSSDSASGLIVATRGGNRVLTWSDPTINIIVSWAAARASLAVSSMVGGQVLDYGTTESTMKDYCAALLSLRPTATCAVGKQS